MPEGEERIAPPNRSGPWFWPQCIFGLAVVGAGGWMIYSRGGSTTGFLIACVGAMIAPLGIVRLLGGLAAAGLGAWLIVNGLGLFDYVYGAIIVFVGGSAALDGFRTLRGTAAP